MNVCTSTFYIIFSMLLSLSLCRCHPTTPESKPSKNTTQKASIDNSLPYGAWWLLNPSDIAPNIIAGALIICDKNKDKRMDDDVTFVTFDKNVGHGCTDYVGTGSIKETSHNQRWDIYFNDFDGTKDIKVFWGVATKKGDSLTIRIANSQTILKFEASTEEEVEKRCSAACKVIHKK